MSNNNQTETTTALATTREQEAAAALARIAGDDYYSSAGEGTEKQPPRKFAAVPYIGFRSPKTSNKLDEMIAAGVERNKAYLYDNEVIKIDPFSLHVLRFARFYTKERDRKLIGASFVPAEGFNDKLFGVAVVRIGGGLGIKFKAAGFQLSGAMTKALDRVTEILDGRAKKGESWAATSARHAAAVAAEPKSGPVIPGARCFATVFATTEKPRNGGPHDYQLGHGTMGVTTPDEIAAFYNWFAEAKSGELAKVSAQFEGRVAYLRKVANGEIDPTASREEEETDE